MVLEARTLRSRGQRGVGVGVLSRTTFFLIGDSSPVVFIQRKQGILVSGPFMRVPGLGSAQVPPPTATLP